MRRAHFALSVLVFGFAGASSVQAQTSASFKLTESVLNAGGEPQNGTSAGSTSYHIKLDAIGDTVAAASLGSASFHTDAGFVGRYPPPGEVQSLLFTGKTAMVWSPERSVGAYEVYRDTVASLPASFGTCFVSGASSEAAVDAGSPSSGQGWFYLVTARNGLGEEGTKGARTGGTERPNAAPCP